MLLDLSQSCPTYYTAAYHGKVVVRSRGFSDVVDVELSHSDIMKHTMHKTAKGEMSTCLLAESAAYSSLYVYDEEQVPISKLWVPRRTIPACEPGVLVVNLWDDLPFWQFHGAPNLISLELPKPVALEIQSGTMILSPYVFEPLTGGPPKEGYFLSMDGADGSLRVGHYLVKAHTTQGLWVLSVKAADSKPPVAMVHARPSEPPTIWQHLESDS